MKTAICPGSFDPVTVGHLDIITRAAGQFDRVVVLVSVNSAKRYLFSASQRVQLLQAACAPLTNVQVTHSAELVAQVAQRFGATALVKGVRTAADFEYEYTLAQTNRWLETGLETFLLPADPALGWISSTVAREMLRYHQPTRGLIPEGCSNLLQQFLKNNAE